MGNVWAILFTIPGVMLSIIIVQLLGSIILYSQYGILGTVIELSLSIYQVILSEMSSVLQTILNIKVEQPIIEVVVILFQRTFEFAFRLIQLLSVIDIYIARIVFHIDITTLSPGDFSGFINQNKHTFYLIGTVLLEGFLPALLIHLWLPLFLIAAIVNRGVGKFFQAVKWAQWFIKRGAQHPLEAMGMTASVIVFAVAVVIRLVIYFSAS